MDRSRRTTLGLLGAAGGLAALAPAASGSSAPAAGSRKALPAFDGSNPRQLATVFRKFAYSLDDSVTFWWMRGMRFGVVGNTATPFWDMYIGAWLRTRDLPDGRYEVRMVNANFYTAPGDSRLLEKFANPFTGRTVDVPYSRPRVSTSTHDQRGGSVFGQGGMPGMKSVERKTDIGPAWIEGNEMHVRGDLSLRAEPEDPARAVLTVQDWSLYIGSLEDALDPAVRNPPARQVFNDILNFPPWLQMGDHPGTFYSHCYGRKAFAYEQMPARWRELFEYRFPDVARDAAALLSA